MGIAELVALGIQIARFVSDEIKAGRSAPDDAAIEAMVRSSFDKAIAATDELKQSAEQAQQQNQST